MRDTGVPHTATFAEIKEHLGKVIPCYGDPGGCCADDETNARECSDNACLMLRLYEAGYKAAVADLQKPTPKR